VNKKQRVDEDGKAANSGYTNLKTFLDGETILTIEQVYEDRELSGFYEGNVMTRYSIDDLQDEPWTSSDFYYSEAESLESGVTHETSSESCSEEEDENETSESCSEEEDEDEDSSDSGE
jgi:hypothetical protein